MRLLVAGMVFVIGSLVCVAEELPNPFPGPGKESQPVQDSCTDEDQEASPPNTGSKNSSAPDDLQRSAIISKGNVQDSCKQPGEPPPDNRIVWLTVGLLIVGCIQAYVYWRQAGYMREGLEVTRQSAKAAQDSAIVAKATLKLTQRAYVVAEQWKLRVDVTRQVTGLVCTLRNAGHTHAIIGDGSLNSITGLEMPVPPDPSMLPPTRKGPFTIAAQGVLEYSLPLTAEKWEEVCPPARGRQALYFYGYITYTDALTSDMHCHVVFCVRCQHPTLNPTPVDEPGYNYST